MESLNTALLVNVGTTAEPINKAIDEVTSESTTTIFLVYGRAIADQEIPPFSIAAAVIERVNQLKIECRTYELDKPENFERAFTFYQDLIDEVISYKPDTIIVDITGGTKIMAAAMTHSVLTRQLGTEIIFEYVGGPRNANGRVKDMVLLRDSGIVMKENIAAVIDSIRRQEFARAIYLANSLPRHGRQVS